MPTENELKIAVVDDIENDRIQNVTMTERILQEANIPHSISGYENARALLTAIQNGAKFQLLLLDVVMNEMDGMALAEELRRQRNKADIVFISSCCEMALRGYEVSAARFLAKPLEEEKLREALLHCCRRYHEKKEILLPTENGQHRISFTDIQFVEAFDRGARFVQRNEVVETKLKFSEVERTLPKSSFILCHRGFIVNLSCVKHIRPFEFELKSGAVVPIGKPRYYEINKHFLRYITD